MEQTLIFLPWFRSGIYGLANSSAGAVARLSGSIPLQLATLDNSDSRSANIPFEIMGPGDVSGISTTTIKNTIPPRDTLNAEANKYVHVELAESDIPWRYTPQSQGGTNGNVLRPWITLLVGTSDEIEVLENNQVTLSPEILSQHPLDKAASYAHVQLEINTEIEEPAELTNDQINNLIEEYDGRSISRLLSWRKLEAHNKYIAVIVPTFTPSGNYSWTGTENSPVTISNYYLWNFSTGDEGDFRTLAAKLRPLKADSEFGLAPLQYNRIEPHESMEIRGALAPIGGNDEDVSNEVTEDLKKLTTPLEDDRGRPILSLPLYGDPWTDESLDDIEWAKQVNYDPRHRGVAGLGLAGGIHLQEIIVEAVKKQVGEIKTTNQRINQLIFGIQAASSLWKKRLPKSPMNRLMLLGSSLHRMATKDGKAIDVVAGKERPIPASIFTSAAIRILRGGTARSKHSKNNIRKFDLLLPKLNTCPAAPEKELPGLPSISDFSKSTGNADLEESLSQGGFNTNNDILDKVEDKVSTINDIELQNIILRYVGRIRRNNLFAYNPICLFIRVILWFFNFIKNITTINFCFLCNILPFVCNFINSINNKCKKLSNIPYVVLIQILVLLENPEDNRGEIIALINNDDNSIDDNESLIELGTSIITSPDPIKCVPIELEKLEKSVKDLVDPTVNNPWIKSRVLSTIEGYESENLEPVEICTSVDLPTWRFLKENEPNWLLPGVGQLKNDSIYAFESNPTFVDAFKIGLNTQTLAELRWRNVPIISRCTPLRMFWGRTNIAHTERLDDITGIHSWDSNTSLGSADHIQSDSGKHLVLVMRTDIFRRYPNTLVSSIKAKLDINGEPDFSGSAEPTGDEDRLTPIFEGNVTEDVNFFGFPISPEETDKYWFVIEEAPPGYRFRSDLTTPIPLDGANFASAHFNDPTRVVIKGNVLVFED